MPHGVVEHALGHGGRRCEHVFARHSHTLFGMLMTECTRAGVLAAREAAVERMRREELEHALRMLLRQWEMKRQQSIAVMGDDDDDGGNEAGIAP